MDRLTFTDKKTLLKVLLLNEVNKTFELNRMTPDFKKPDKKPESNSKVNNCGCSLKRVAV